MLAAAVAAAVCRRALMSEGEVVGSRVREVRVREVRLGQVQVCNEGSGKKWAASTR